LACELEVADGGRSGGRRGGEYEAAGKCDKECGDYESDPLLHLSSFCSGQSDWPLQ
jgi:hypothetical protein